MTIYWLALQIEQNNFRVSRYTLLMFWAMKYGSNPEIRAEMDILRLTNRST